ncbi:MAG TPA: GNAT family protein, partial [Solirubrobacteraceae bacterium]|nr:GNAT family protein [Solirubrobacteraceae bacterium]
MRVLLRNPTEDDRAEVIAVMKASARLHRPWVTGVTTNEAYDRVMLRVADPRHDPNLVCRRKDGAIVGFFNISEIVRAGLQSAFLGYSGVAAHAGQGYMTEGMQLLLRRAFTELRLHRLEANIQPGNAASRALAERSGFVHEGFSERYLKIGGRWRDHERYAINAEQWRAFRRRARGA